MSDTNWERLNDTTEHAMRHGFWLQVHTGDDTRATGSIFKRVGGVWLLQTMLTAGAGGAEQAKTWCIETADARHARETGS